MKFDVQKHIGAVVRGVVAGERDGKPTRIVSRGRSFDSDIDDAWDALTNPNGSRAGSRRSAAISSSAAAIRSRAMPAARSPNASRRAGLRLTGSLAVR